MYADFKCKDIRELMQSLLPNYVNYINKAQNSFKIMQEATVLIFVMNTLSKEYRKFLSFEEDMLKFVILKAICASIENMLLTANNLGVRKFMDRRYFLCIS